MAKRRYYRRPSGLYETQRTINGKKYYFSARTEKEMDEKLMNFSNSIKKGRLFSEVANEWYEIKKKNISSGTKRSYDPAFRRVLQYFGDSRIGSIEPYNVSAFLMKLKEDGFAKKTVSNNFIVLSMIFKYAIINGEIRDNPAQYISVPSNLPQSKRLPPTDKQIEIVKNNVRHKYGLLPFFLLYTGLRIGEALAVQYKDIKDGYIHINGAVKFNGNNPVIDSTKTKAGIRKVPLLEVLEKHIPKGKKDDFLFGGEKPYTQSMLNRRWTSYWKDTGETEEIVRRYKKRDGSFAFAKDYKAKVTPHQFRHEFTSAILEAGIDEKVAQTLLGYADVYTMRNVYQHIRDHQLEIAKNTLDRYFNGR